MGIEQPDFIRWTSQIGTVQNFTVMPDGCRDIVTHKTRSGTHITLTSLDLRPRHIQLQPGDAISGYRLQPGLQISESDVAGLQPHEISDLIGHIGSQQTDLSEAITTLGQDNTPVGKVAKQLGVSLRTLQRRLARCGQPGPEFWRLLGRARRAAIALGAEGGLSDIAYAYGYSDQSHMTRACRHWFGHTPTAIRANATILQNIDQPALGTWGRAKPAANQASPQPANTPQSDSHQDH